MISIIVFMNKNLLLPNWFNNLTLRNKWLREREKKKKVYFTNPWPPLFSDTSPSKDKRSSIKSESCALTCISTGEGILRVAELSIGWGFACPSEVMRIFVLMGSGFAGILFWLCDVITIFLVTVFCNGCLGLACNIEGMTHLVRVFDAWGRDCNNIIFWFLVFFLGPIPWISVVLRILGASNTLVTFSFFSTLLSTGTAMMLSFKLSTTISAGTERKRKGKFWTNQWSTNILNKIQGYNLNLQKLQNNGFKLTKIPISIVQEDASCLFSGSTM